MAFLRTATLTSALALTASGAFGLTADEVWQDMADLMAAGGATVTTESEDRSGNTITITGLTMVTQLPDNQGSATTVIPEISFTEMGDGSVSVDFPPEMTVESSSTMGDTTVEMDMVMTHDNFSAVVSGEETVERYDFSADAFSVTMDEFDAPQEDGSILTMAIAITSEGLTGSYDISGDMPRDIESASTVDRITFDVSGEGPETGDAPESFAFTGSLNGLTSTGSATLTEMTPGLPLAEMIEGGFAFAARLGYDSGAYKISADGADGAFTYESSAADGVFDIAVGTEGLRYAGESSGITMQIFGDAIPLPPIAVTLAKSAFGLSLPVVPADEPQAFGLNLQMVDLEVPEMLWSMFDPQGALAHDPATLIIDIDGEATVTEDFTNPANMESGEAPGELHAVNVSELRLSLAGAELTGDGAFTFTTSEEGIPQPDGVANLMLTGGNALLDSLVQMGLLPEEQAMGARMMIGLFAKPGDNEDTLVSEIEVNADGSVLANGQRIR